MKYTDEQIEAAVQATLKKYDVDKNGVLDRN